MSARKYLCAALAAFSVGACGSESSDSVGGASVWDGEPGRLWVTNSLRDSISEIDTATGSSLEEYDIAAVGEEPANIDVCNGSVWFNAVGEMGRITPARSVEAVEAAPYDLVCGEGSVWANTGIFVERFDAQTGAALASIEVETLLYDPIAFGSGSAWVLDGTSVHRIDASTNQVSAEILLSGASMGLAVTSALAFGEGALWVLGGTATNAVLIKIDPATNAVVASEELPTADATADIAAGFGSVWVSSAWDGNDDDDEVFAIDPATLQVERSIALPGAAPSTLELGARFLYVYGTFSTGALSYERRLYRIDPGSGATQSVAMVATSAGFDAIPKMAFEAR